MTDAPIPPLTPTAVLVGHLHRRGYPTGWISEQIGEPSLKHYLRVGKSPDVTYQHIEALCRAYGHRNSTVTDGITAESARWARRTAHRNCSQVLPYDQEIPVDERKYLPGFDHLGRFDPRYLPGHKWAQADDLVGRLYDALRLIVGGCVDAHTVERETGVYDQQESRLRRLIGLNKEQVKASPGDDGQDYRMVERWPGALDAARTILARFDEALDKGQDLIPVALDAGIVALFHTKAPAGTPRITNGHPAVVAWKAARQQVPAAA